MKVLLVDDDELLVEKIVEGMDWEKLGVSMVFTANNIRQAKAILSEYSIQLLISDIEMPQGNGLELLEWIREQEIQLKCIFISSYAYFTYAQKALQLNSSQYLLKPVSDAELSRAITEVLGTMKRETQSSEEEQAKKKQQFWTDYLERWEGDLSPEEIREQAGKLYGAEDAFAMFLVKIFPGIQDTPWKKQSYCACQIEEAAVRAWKGMEAMVKYRDLEWVLVSRVQENMDTAQAAMLLEKELAGSMNENFCIFFNGEKTGELKPLIVASDLGIIADTRIVDTAKWNRRREADTELLFSKWEKDILITDNLKDLGEQIIGRMEKECREARVARMEFEQYRLALSRMAFRWLEYQKLQVFQFFSDTEFEEKYKGTAFCMRDMRDFIRWMFEKMDGYRHTDSRQEILVEKLKNHIEQNLKEDLSRKELAKIVYLSEDYVAKLFSGETGMSISSYVTRRRMEKAKEYLVSTEWNVSRIAMEVGYTNFSYFSKMFREFAGCTPNEYRNQNTKNKK